MKNFVLLSQIFFLLAGAHLLPTVSFALVGDTRDAVEGDNLESLARVGDASGVLIGSNIVLTAGHVVGFGYDEITELKISFPHSSSPDKVFTVQEWKSVERGMFPTRYLDHSGQDLAVLFLKQSPQYMLSISPIPLYKSTGDTLVGQNVMLAGYGRFSLSEDGLCSGSTSRTLKVASSVVLEHLNEPGRWGAPLIIGHPNVSPCDGDSGSPALVKIQNKLYVVGITSGPYNPPIGPHLGRPYQYADIGSALPWLKKVIPSSYRILD